jgi:hypothetical protein
MTTESGYTSPFFGAKEQTKRSFWRHLLFAIIEGRQSKADDSWRSISSATRGRRTSAVAVGRSPFDGRCCWDVVWGRASARGGWSRSGLVTVILLAGVASLGAHLLCVVRPRPLNPLLEDLAPLRRGFSVGAP